MNEINVDIVRSLFMPLFLGGTLAAAAVMAILRWGEPGAMVMLAGGLRSRHCQAAGLSDIIA